MPINPNPNNDPTSNQITSEPDSWSSPKSTATGNGEGNFVKFDNDDLYPERIERLGQYLSDTTIGIVNADSRGGQGNEFPISPPGETTPTYTEQLSGAMENAVQYYETLSKQTSFDPHVGELELDGSYGSGHSLLQERAQQMVRDQISTTNNNPNSRWYGIQQQRFAPATGETDSADLYQVQKTGECLDTSEPGGTTKFTSYTHKSGLENKDSARGDFWTDYFDRLSLVGAKITLAATGYDMPSESNDPGSITTKPTDFGQIVNGDLQGNYRRQPVRLTEPGNTFKSLDGTETYDRYDDISKEFAKTETKRMNAKTYGQMNSWNDPFETTGFPLVENQGLRVAKQLLEIWAMVVLRILITTSLLQVASYVVSLALQNVDTEPGLQGPLGVNWNRNYYPPSPQIIPGSAFFQGSSGFNHPATDILTRGMNALNRGIASTTGPGGTTALFAMQVLGPALNTGMKILEDEYLNLTVAIQRELNIYIPRHILSTMANEIGYNSPSAIPGINKVIKGLDIYTAYLRAYTAGMGSLIVHITAGDYGKSLAFWKTIFRTVVRSKAHWGTYVNNPDKSAYDSLLHFMGKDDKIMKFANYLAMIGDIGTAAGEAGNIAFPENKVPLHQVGNFPTLRTIGGRKRGSKTQSRLSLTETPGLLLIPNNIALIKHNLKLKGVEENSTYGDISGENSLWIKDDEIKKQIGNKYQKSDSNRFSPDQVRMVEDQLEGEHMPFYIHDLRTNEIISFHAFLTSLSDSYSAEWSAQKGFGRLEAAQIYGGGSRSIGLSFTLVSMNPEDFDEMYYKINKLTTLIYPQWSEGTLMDGGESTFIQPFSQVPTASPLCRIRVGDLFTSNYSKVAMARMMGIGNSKFKYTEPGGTADDASDVEEFPTMTADELIKKARYIKFEVLQKAMETAGFTLDDQKEKTEMYKDDPTQFVTEFHEVGNGVWGTGSGMVATNSGLLKRKIPFTVSDKNTYLSNTLSNPEEGVGIGGLGGLLSGGGDPAGIASLFSASGDNANPILKSFNSTMGRGIAVAITGITFDWKLNSVPWELTAGNRAPRMCEVQLSIIPIHDITPGLDHQGINRAPIYKVGSKSKSLTGDVWYNEKDYNTLVNEVEIQHKAHLRGEEEE